MATSGQINTNTEYDSYFWVKWSQKEQNIDGNYTIINWSCGVTPGHKFGTNAIKMSAVTINGTKVYNGGTYSNFKDYKSHTLGSGTLRISHDTDGKKTFTISAFTGWLYSNHNYSAAEKSFTLTAIPRASYISCTTVDIESNPVITISRASSNFTHTVTYEIGDIKGTIASKTSATRITNWTIPASVYSQIPNDKRGNGYIYCTTYHGSTKIGERNDFLFFTTDETKCKPTVSGNVIDTNPKTADLTGAADKALVRFHSTASCTLTASLNKNAGKFLTKTINNVSVSGATLDIKNVETGTFDFYAKDSREYFNSDKVTRTLVPYIKLTNDATIYRDDPTSGDATIKIEGNYFNGSFGAKENTLTVEYRLEGEEEYISVTPTIKDNKYSATVPLTGLDYTKSFNFEVVVTDKLERVPKPLTLPKGIPVFDWGEEDFNFNVPVTINGVNILEKLAELEKLVKG